MLHSRILPSVQPKIGKSYSYQDLEARKNSILNNTRKQLLRISIDEANRDIISLQDEMKKQSNTLKVHQSEDEQKSTKSKIDNERSKEKHITSIKHRKKLHFHGYKGDLNVDRHSYHSLSGRNKKRIKTKERKQKNNKLRHKRIKEEDKKRLKETVDKIIEDNLVVNISSYDIPDLAMVYLSKGLNFVETKEVDKADLKYDTLEFLRSMACASERFTEKKRSPITPNQDSDNQAQTKEKDVHANLRVKSKYKPATNHPLYDEVERKLLTWVDQFQPTKPKPNISPGKKRGAQWLRKMCKEKKIFISKADKGGATLILNYEDVVATVEKDIFNEELYEKADFDMMLTTPLKVQELVLEQVDKGHLSSKQCTMITGLNENRNMKRSADYVPEPPGVYPLYKLHSMTPQQLTEKVVPKHRLVSSVKFGPLYRLDKFVSPYLTTLSQEYCAREYILDTSEFLKSVDRFNSECAVTVSANSPNKDYLLFTIDVKALYPSIDPTLAQRALEDALQKNTSFADSEKEMIHVFTTFILFNQFVTYKGSSYKGKKGMATGGSSSRQCADMFLTWMIFQKPEAVSSLISLWENILLWVRFIDDVFGIWNNTEELFLTFIQELNQRCAEFGIEYDKWEIDTSVNFLDTTCFLHHSVAVTEDETPTIQHKLYRKPTDARRYLKPDSHHPPHVFPATVKSQMKRIFRLNSCPDHLNTDLNQLVEDLVNNGYDKEMVVRTQRELQEAEEEGSASENSSETTSTLIFNVEYFKELPDLKSFVRGLGDDINTLVGHKNITFATRKGPTIGSRLVKNAELCQIEEDVKVSQKCMRKNCKSCSMMMDTESVSVNGYTHKLPKNVDCKSKNVIYLQSCSDHQCMEEEHNSYTGQTRQEFRERNNGHRSKFNINKHEDSALAHHSYMDHGLGVKLKDFKCAIVKKCKVRQLDREEFKFIERFQTLTKGLNRCKIIKSNN